MVNDIKSGLFPTILRNPTPPEPASPAPLPACGEGLGVGFFYGQ
ncbi:hypothetical protein [Coleofasciculus sp. FACHB-129]|nr:hypothetical protein [Coleofasciculus sp. FACHB-129]